MMAYARPIIITGFMAAGKTSVARALAERLACPLIDLDEFIRKRDGRTPQEIIVWDGEKHFREVEAAALNAALLMEVWPVIALGGGAWTIPRNRRLIEAYEGFSVWLDAPFELCWQRIIEGKMDRPLARDRETAQKLYDSRLELYRLASLHVKISAEQSPEMIAAEIEEVLLKIIGETREQDREI